MKKLAEKLSPKVVLGIAAHPDDLDFGASASFAKWANQGADVYYLIVTDGSKGSDDPAAKPDELVTMRQQEQRNAARIVGARDVFFLGYEDSALEITLQLKKDIVKYIRMLQPDVVVTMDPSMIYSKVRGVLNHPDHRAAAQAALDAVYPLARDRLTFPEYSARGLLPHKVRTLLLINFDEQNYYEDVSNYFEMKMQALEAHTSQIPDASSLRAAMETLASQLGGKGGFKYAEAFLRFDID